MLLLSYCATSSTYFQLLLSHFWLFSLLNSHFLQHFILSFTFWSSHSSLPYRYSFFTHSFSFYCDSSYPIFFTINKLLSPIQSIFPTLEYVNTLSLSLSHSFFFFLWVYNSFLCLHYRVMNFCFKLFVCVCVLG